MTKALWARNALEAVPSNPKVRWGRSGLEGSVPLVPKVRWGRSAVTGAAAVVVAALPDQTVEPESTVTIAASLLGGGAADSWTFRRVSGPSIGIAGTGASRTFTAPSAMPPAGATVVIGVTATLDGVTSPERTCTITVLPQVSWVWNGTTFVGAKHTAISV
jgi:hypothetical protein